MVSHNINTKLVNKFEWSLLLHHLTYFGLLLGVYTSFIVVNYGYLGIVDSLNIEKIYFSVVLIITALFTIRNSNAPSFFYLNLILVISLTPSLVIVCGSNVPLSFGLITWLAFITVAAVVYFVKLPRITSSKYINSITLLRLFSIFSLVFVASIFLYGGGRFINFDFSKVYEFRDEAAANLPGIYAYITPNFTYAIIPTGVALSLRTKQRLPFFIFILCAVLIFSLTSHKGPLFISATVIFAYWLSSVKKNVLIMIVAFSVIVGICGVVYFLENFGIEGVWKWISAIFTFRTIILPNYINFQHYDFFTTNPYYYWADSKFTLGLVASPYSLPMPYQISMINDGYENMGSANTGWIGSGMGNAGFIGIAFYSILLGLFLSLIDAYSRKLGKSTVFAIFIVPVITAAQSVDLATMVLTNGLLVQLVILLLLEPDRK